MAMRIFWYLDVFPGRVAEGRAPAGLEGSGISEGAGSDPGPRPSRLTYRRVVMGDG